MPVVRSMRLLASIESGTTDGAALEAALADSGRRSEFVGMLSQRSLARRLAASSVSTNAILTSPLALASVMQSDVAAQEFAGSSVSSNILKASPVAMKAATLNEPGMRAWVSQFPSVSRSFANTQGGTSRINDVAYGAGLYVAVGDNGTIITSPDLVTWTARTNPTGTTSNHMTSVAYGGGYFVAIGTNGSNVSVASSPDGITWTVRPLPFSTVSADGARNIIYADGKFVSLWFYSGQSRVCYAANPTGTWTSVTVVPHSHPVNQIAYRPGAGFAVSVLDTTPVSWNVAVSADLVNWKTSLAAPVGASSNSYVYQLAAGPEYFYAMVTSSTYGIMRSRDGLGWEQMSVETSTDYPDTSGKNCCLYAGGGFFRLTSANRIRVSTDHGASSKNFAAFMASSPYMRLAYANGIIFMLSNSTAYATHIPIA